MNTVDYYKILEIGPNSSPAEIKKGYLALVKVWHPDRFASDPVAQRQAQERMREINCAYEALKSGATRGRLFARREESPEDAAASEEDQRFGFRRDAYAYSPRTSLFSLWEGRTSRLTVLGAVLLGGVVIFSGYSIVEFLMDFHASPKLTEDIRHEARQKAVLTRMTMAAESGERWAQANLGWSYLTGRGVRADEQTAIKWFRKAADQGDVGVQAQLGAIYARGSGVPQDFAVAASWFRKAAEQGDAPAREALAEFYAHGNGVPVDLVRAYAWWNLAATQGRPNAAVQRDALTLRLTPQQLGEAQRLITQLAGATAGPSAELQKYLPAAEAGDRVAQNHVGVIFNNGAGVPQDFTEAARWYRRAAEQGDAHAQSNLALLLRHGQGLPRDLVAAYTWWNLAASQGHRAAQAHRDELARDLTREQLAEGQRRSSEFVARRAAR